LVFFFDHGKAMTSERSSDHPGGARMTCGRSPHQKSFLTKQKNQNLNDADSTYLMCVLLVLNITDAS
jgi:hypothetical protein